MDRFKDWRTIWASHIAFMGGKEFYFFVENVYAEDGYTEIAYKTHVYVRDRGSSSPATFLREFPWGYDGVGSGAQLSCIYINGCDSNNFRNGDGGDFLYNGKMYCVIVTKNIDPKTKTDYKKVLFLSDTLEPIAELPRVGNTFIIADGMLYLSIREKDRIGAEWQTIRCLNTNKVVSKMNIDNGGTIGQFGAKNVDSESYAERLSLKHGNTYLLMSSDGTKRIFSLSGKEILKPGEFDNYFKQTLEKSGIVCPPFWMFGGYSCNNAFFFGEEELQKNPSFPAGSFVVLQYGSETDQADQHAVKYKFAVTMDGNITGPYKYDKNNGSYYIDETYEFDWSYDYRGDE